MVVGDWEEIISFVGQFFPFQSLFRSGSFSFSFPFVLNSVTDLLTFAETKKGTRFGGVGSPLVLLFGGPCCGPHFGSVSLGRC